MIGSGYGIPQGYNYPVPSTPFIEGSTVTTERGYSYPVPDNPLIIERQRVGKVVTEEGDTSHLIVIGLKHNEFDSYDPAEYDHNDPDYLDFSLNFIGQCW